MIILINGTYGVGKSSVSKEIQRQIENGKVRLFDPDGFYQDIKKEIFYDIILNGGGVNPQNNISFLNRVKKELKVFMNKEIMCIVPMAVTTKESLEIIWKYLYTNEKEFCHFILDADESAITERIVSLICFLLPPYLFSFGSNASRRPSPRRLKASVIRQIIRDGNTSFQG